MMQISCQECSKSFNLPRHKIPDTGIFRFSCPACGAKNRIDANKEPDGRTAAPEQTAAQTPEKNIEPEQFPPGSKVALLYVLDPGWFEEAKGYLTAQGFHLSLAQSPEEGAQKLRLNRYQLVLLEEGYQTEVLLREISLWPGRYRREVNCLLLGDSRESFDAYTGFLQGVNTYLSKKDKDRAEQILDQARDDFARYLKPWHAAADHETGA